MNKINSFRGAFAFLSNFHPAIIKYAGIVYPTAEHLYMALKTLDKDERIHISSLSSPSTAKQYGRTVQLRPNWDKIKFDVMTVVVRRKFAQNLSLKEKLLATKDAILEEANWWGDTYWGTCNGEGENNLGKILMTIREEYEKNR